MRKLILILSLISIAAHANPVYKCETDGKTVYNDQVCSGGKEVKVHAQPTEADQASARARAKKEQQIEKKLERQKLKREVAEERARQKANRQAAIKHKKCAHLAQRAKWADEDVKKATGRSLEKAQRKSRRTTEKYVLECPK